MKNTRVKGTIVILIMALMFSACNKAVAQTGGGKKINRVEELTAYLNSQPANSPDKPIKVAMKANDDIMLKKIAEALTSAGKYVSLDLSGSTITTIPNGAFYTFKGNDKLTSITIPKSVTSIGSSAFAGCANLASITIPDGVTSIGEAAFVGCTALPNITIPNSITDIVGNAFVGCTSLTAINVNASNTAYSSDNGVLYNKNKTTLIAYPAGKNEIYFTIPDSVTSIEWGTFISCTNLASLTIPNKVISIREFAFAGCTSLTSVTFQGTISSDNFNPIAFGSRNWGDYIGDLRDKYLAGGVGTYTRANGGETWTKQP